jgi:intracellular septation protein A
MNNLLYAIRPLFADLASTFIFVIVSAVTHNPMAATAAAMSYGIGQVVWLKLKGRPVAPLQWMSLGLVVVFGTATLLTDNSRFMMLKPTVIYVLIGGVMLRRGWMLRYMPPAAAGLAEDQMIRWGYVWSGLMFLSAALNLALALLSTLAVWSAFSTIFLPGSKIALFLVQYFSIRATSMRRARAARAASAAESAQVLA